MLEVIQFILSYTAKFISMLFTINLGSGLNLGLLLCITFILLPLVLRIVSYIKNDALQEINDASFEKLKIRKSKKGSD